MRDVKASRLRSELARGEPELSLEVSSAPLGDAYERKNRGRFQQIDPAGGFVRLLDVVGDDQLAQHLTVHASARPVESYTAATRANVPPIVLRVSWGTDGAAHEAELDLVQGACFSVAASSLRVDAAIEPPYGEESQEPANVAVSVGYYPSPTRATRTFRRVLSGDDGPASLQLVPIPAFATRVEVLRYGIQAVFAGFLDASQAVTFGGVLTSGPIDLPIPNGAAFLALEKWTGEPTQIASAIFHLGL